MDLFKNGKKKKMEDTNYLNDDFIKQIHMIKKEKKKNELHDLIWFGYNCMKKFILIVYNLLSLLAGFNF